MSARELVASRETAILSPFTCTERSGKRRRSSSTNPCQERWDEPTEQVAASRRTAARLETLPSLQVDNLPYGAASAELRTQTPQSAASSAKGKLNNVRVCKVRPL